MSTSTETECMFDGNCRLSRNADITLEFDDGSTLMAHSVILCMASPVLETALKDCTSTKKLRLRSVDKDVWTSILKELYPSKSDIQENIWSTANFDAVVLVGKECHKYGIQSVLDSIDDLIAHEMKVIPPPHQVAWDARVGFYGKLATSLKLRRATEVTKDCVLTAMVAIGQKGLFHFKDGIHPPTRYPRSMIEVLKSLYEVEDLERIKNFLYIYSM